MEKELSLCLAVEIEELFFDWMNYWFIDKFLPKILSGRLLYESTLVSKLAVLSFKPLIFIPDVLKTSQEEDANTNQDQICWFSSISVSINFKCLNQFL
jgi:hypothetical protein